MIHSGGGGRILVRVPLADSDAAERYGPDWVQLDAPRHRTIPTAAGVAALAGRLGLSIVDAWRDSTAFQFWASELYRKGGFLAECDPAEAFSPDAIAQWERDAAAVNAAGRGDQGVFVLRRREDGE